MCIFRETERYLSLGFSHSSGSQWGKGERSFYLQRTFWQWLETFWVVTTGGAQGGRRLLTSNWQGPWMLLNILQCTEQLSKQRIIHPNISIILRLRNPVLQEERFQKKNDWTFLSLNKLGLHNPCYTKTNYCVFISKWFLYISIYLLIYPTDIYPVLTVRQRLF